MSDSTYEEAKRCPICKESGEKTGDSSAGVRARPGTRIHSFTCRNARCRWHDGAPWVVQINPDGTVPAPNTHRSKAFPSLPTRDDATQEAINQRLLNSTLEGGETR